MHDLGEGAAVRMACSVRPLDVGHNVGMVRDVDSRAGACRVQTEGAIRVIAGTVRGSVRWRVRGGVWAQELLELGLGPQACWQHAVWVLDGP